MTLSLFHSVLYTPWGDKSLVRNAVIYNMSASEGWYCTRTQFVEVFLNSNSSVGWDYIGVYVFEEKIRRGKDRVDVAKLTPKVRASFCLGKKGGGMILVVVAVVSAF